MPNIPKYRQKPVPMPQATMPSAPRYPTPDEKAFGIGPEIAEIASKTAASLAKSAEVFHQADQDNKLMNAKVGAADEIHKFERDLINRTDHENFMEDFAKLRKNLEGTLVDGLAREARNSFSVYFSSLADQAAMRTQVSAWKQIKENAEGDYIRRTAKRLSALGVADDDRREQLMYEHEQDLKNMGTYMPADWVENEAVKFRIDADTILAMQDSMRDPDNFNPYDRSRYKLLPGDTAARMEQANATRMRALADREQRDEDRKIRLEEKALKNRRERTYSKLLYKAMKGDNIFEDVFDAIENGDLVSDKGRELLEANKDGITDNEYLVNIRKRILLGEGTLNSVLSEISSSGQLSATDKLSMLDKAHTMFNSSDVSKTPRYKAAQEFIEKHVRLKGQWGDYDQQNEIAIEAALDEFDRRVREGEPIIQLRNEIAASYRTTRLLGDTYAPLYGTVDNVKHAYQETMKAYKRKEMTDERCFNEIKNLKKIADQQGLTLPIGDRFSETFKEMKGIE